MPPIFNVLMKYTGQSGAPVLRKSDKLVSIGTHCYGGGGRENNSGNPIGGKYGNNYKTFLALLNTPANLPVKPNDIQLVNAAAATTGGTTESADTPDGSEESFISVLQTVGKITGSLPVNVGGVLGAILQGVTVAGKLAGGSESAIPADTLAPGAAERACVADFCLQALLNAENSKAQEECFRYMHDNWKQPGCFDFLSKPLNGVLTEAAATSAIDSLNQVTIFNADKSAPDDVSDLPVGEFWPALLAPIAIDLVGGLVKKITESAELEDEDVNAGPAEFSFAGLIKKGLDLAKPLVGKGANLALDLIKDKGIDFAKGAIGGLLGGRTESTGFGGLDEATTGLLFRRAQMADLAYEALKQLPQEKLDQLMVKPPAEADEFATEGFSLLPITDFLGKVINKHGAGIIRGTKAVIRQVGPILVDAIQGKAASAPAVQNGAGSERALTTSPSLADLWHSRPAIKPRTPAVKVSFSRSRFPSRHALEDDELAALLQERQASWEPSEEVNPEWDDNPDHPVVANFIPRQEKE
jgi:hypothetical protein